MAGKKPSNRDTRRVTVRLPGDHHLFQYPERVRAVILRERIEIGRKIDMLAEKLSVLIEKIESLEKRVNTLQERITQTDVLASAGTFQDRWARLQGQQQADTGTDNDDEFKRAMQEMLKYFG